MFRELGKASGKMVAAALAQESLGEVLRVDLVECHFECHSIPKIGRQRQTAVEISKRQIVAMLRLTRESHVFMERP